MSINLQTTGKYKVAYWESVEGYGEQWTPDGCVMTRRVKVEWANRRNFILDMLGWTEQGWDWGTGLLKRWMPNKHPAFTDFVCVEANYQGNIGVPIQDAAGRYTVDLRDDAGVVLSSGSGVGDGYAVYDLKYRRPNYYIANDADVTSELQRYVIRRSKTASESMRIPGQAFKYSTWLDAGTPTGTPIPLLLAGTTILGDTTRRLASESHIIEWLQVPQLPLTKIRAALGKVNSATFDVPGAAFAAPGLNAGAETLLLQSVEWEPKQHASSVYYWDIRFTFMGKSDIGWNKVYQRFYNDFFRAVDRNTGAGIYGTYDFNNLFIFT